MKRFVYIFLLAAVLGVWIPGVGAYVSDQWRSDSVMSVMDFQQIDAELGTQKTLVPGVESKWIICRNDPVNRFDPDGRVALVDDATILTAVAVTAAVVYLASPSPTDPSRSNATVMVDSAISVFERTFNAIGNVLSSSEEEVVEIGGYLDGEDVSEAGDHADEVGVVTGVVDREGAKARRKANLKGVPVVKGKDRDEYPPASVKPDEGTETSVKPIDPSHNRRSGRRLRDELPPNGTRVRIVPPGNTTTPGV